jgi:hypothetical protein
MHDPFIVALGREQRLISLEGFIYYLVFPVYIYSKNLFYAVDKAGWAIKKEAS